jgi:hypothetical protein
MLCPDAAPFHRPLDPSIHAWAEEVERQVVDFNVGGLRRKLGAECIRNVRGCAWRVERTSRGLDAGVVR